MRSAVYILQTFEASLSPWTHVATSVAATAARCLIGAWRPRAWYVRVTDPSSIFLDCGLTDEKEPISVQRFGLTEISAPDPSSSALVDVVFVHGLNGDPKKTWTSRDSDVFWPEKLLPRFVEEQKVRVLVYGYDADVTSFRGGSGGVTKDKIHNHAESLVADLFANRRVSLRSLLHLFRPKIAPHLNTTFH